MMLELEPPGQQPMMMMTTACTAWTLKASDKAKAVKGIIPNWQRKPMIMPHGFLMWPHNFTAPTVQPMANMTMASKMVSTVLITTPRMALKLLGGTRQSVPEQAVAALSQIAGSMVVGFSVDIAEEEYQQILKLAHTLGLLRVLEVRQVQFLPLSRKMDVTKRRSELGTLPFMSTVSKPNEIGRKDKKLTNSLCFIRSAFKTHAYKK